MSFYLCGLRMIDTGWNGADGDVERRKASLQRGQEVQEGDRSEICDGVGFVSC